MALLSCDASGAASGRFLSQYGGFMAIRSAPQPTTPKIQPHLLNTAQLTEVPAEALSDGHPAAF